MERKSHQSATETLREVLGGGTGAGEPGRLSALVAPYQHTLASAPPEAVRAHRQHLLDHGAWAPLPWITLTPSRAASRTGAHSVTAATPAEGGADAGRWVDALNTRADAVSRRVHQLRADLAARPGGASQTDLLAACYREQHQIRPTADAPLGPVPPPQTVRRQAYDLVASAQQRRPGAEPDVSPVPAPTWTSPTQQRPTGLQR